MLQLTSEMFALQKPLKIFLSIFLLDANSIEKLIRGILINN